MFILRAESKEMVFSVDSIEEEMVEEKIEKR